MPDTEDAAARRPAAGDPPGMPRWVKIGLVVFALLVLLFAVLHLTGVVSGHGPGGHMSQPAGHGGPGALRSGASGQVH